MGNIERIGEFIVRKSKGKIKKEHIRDALLVQKEFSDHDKKMGEILVILGLLTEQEMETYLNLFKTNRLIGNNIGMIDR